jgi:hypothetical protein
MALPTNNIRFGLVNNTLRAGSLDCLTLCQHVNINKWSRFKPVRGSFPSANDGRFGFVFPLFQSNSATSGVYSPSDWGYNTPRGGSAGGTPDEIGRIDDFRGYEHDKAITLPPFYSDVADNIMPLNLAPTEAEELII